MVKQTGNIFEEEILRFFNGSNSSNLEKQRCIFIPFTILILFTAIILFNLIIRNANTATFI